MTTHLRLRPFGSAGPDVPVIGQGTWEMQHDAKDAAEALRRGLDLGMTHIDTAEMYGWGEVETIVGKAIDGRRDEVFLVSKVWPNNASREAMVQSCEATLQRLGTERLDVYLLHWPSNDHPLEETIAAFQDLKQAGKILHFGVSNFDVALLEQAVALAGAGEIVCNQVRYNLQDRSPEGELLAACDRHGVALVGYSPFGQGKFPSKDKTLAAIAKSHSASPQQVALAFLTRLENTFAIPKASRLRHVEDNARADSLELSDQDIAQIDSAFPLSR